MAKIKNIDGCPRDSKSLLMRASSIPDKIGVIIETSAPLDWRDPQDCVMI